MDIFENTHPLRIEFAYAHDDNTLFGERIYRKDARLWLHEDLAAIVLLASALCFANTGYRFVLYDGLRTVDAQDKMLQTQRVKDNPNWLEEPRLLSPSGKGGHPRGMAIDIALEDNTSGELIEMGTIFDDLTPTAHRDANLSDIIMANRSILEAAMMDAARELKTPLLPLPQEWWDFRLPHDISSKYAPLSDADLPPHMRMVSGDNADAPNYTEQRKKLLTRIAPHP